MAVWKRRRTTRPSTMSPVHRRPGFETLEARRLMAFVPIYHSLPSATAALYLDFDGHFEPATGWPQ